MHILDLPAELHQEILLNLAWHEHFIAAQVCQGWASILKIEKFRRKRYVYDKIEPQVKFPGSPVNWGFRRYLPQEEGPPWRPRTGGELSLHGLMWSETLIMVLRREEGEVKAKLLITADAVGYISEPKGLGLLKQFHEKRYGRRSFYDITDSPLLESDKLYFWGEPVAEHAPISDSPVPNHTGKSSNIPEVGFPESGTASLTIRESSGPKFSRVPNISKRLPREPPVVLFRDPTRFQYSERKRKAQYIKNKEGLSGLPSSESKHWTIKDFEETRGFAPEPLYYSGSNSDSIREFLGTVEDYLIEHIFEGDNSNLACWCIFDVEHRYLHNHHTGTHSHRDPRRNVWVPMTILRS